jgi:alkylation response protein AidB-like acyl-CoA dehydrogenase
MNFGLTEDQSAVLAGLDQLLSGQNTTPPIEPVRYSYSAEIDAALVESGFLDIAREEGFGPLEAALIVERVARLPHVVETAATALIAPVLDIPAGTHPIALVTGDASKAARFLPMAKLLIVDRGDDAVLITVDPANVEKVDSLLAYPYGRLKNTKGLEQKVIKDVAALRRRWRIALATEAAGCMAAALAFVVDYVKTRRAFGRALGSFQAIQHRLVHASETMEATKFLAFRAAWSDTETDAAVAAGFAQMRTQQITFDLHQFCGAMGLTLELPLHLWTYRLRALAGELGGASTQSRVAAAQAWPGAA